MICAYSLSEYFWEARQKSGSSSVIWPGVLMRFLGQFGHAGLGHGILRDSHVGRSLFLSELIPLFACVCLCATFSCNI